MVQVLAVENSSAQKFTGELKPVAAALALAYGLGAAGYANAATFTVSTLADSGAGSLRAAVASANGAAGADTINFTVGGTITLTSGEIVISDSVTITGPGAGSLAVSGNNASRIFNIDGTTNPTITISGLTLRNGNAGAGNSGGAILHNTADGDITLQSMVFIQNTAPGRGGALDMSCNACNITINDSSFTANTAGLYGGAIGTESGNNFTVRRTTISGNSSAAGIGGGIFEDDVIMLIEDSTISGNTAGAGGGIFLYADTAATIRNSTISGNTASVGGGIYFYNEGGSVLTIQNSTIANNTGGGIYLYNANATAQLLLASTIVANNTVADIDGSGPPQFTANNSLIRVPAAGAVIAGSGNITGQDPLLGALANNGGPTQTMALQAGSPAINSGSNPAGLAFDQRGAGFPRTVGAQTDMGAVEGVGAPPPPPVITVIPTLSQWGVVLLSVLMAGWAMLTGFGRRRS
ncbi:MAG TPA: IPTL-CTERM sorting domain-containing protein [Casimicrobiaceae bacterium]|nr:IPTL-CTERM sorting domain-containing protein [Casimicrobiaceae bacterium]